MWIIGVDCHKQVHVAVVVDDQGRECGRWRGANTPDGWRQLRDWGSTQASEVIWGIEGSGQYGRGLAQLLVREGAAVREINPRLTARRRQQGRDRGKTDRVDALAIARLVGQDQQELPVVHPDDASAVVAVQVAAREGLVADLTALRNQLHQHLVQVEPIRKGPWPRLTTAQGVAALLTLTVPDGHALLAAHARQVRLLATRMRLVMEQIEMLTHEIEAGSLAWTGPMQEMVGVGPLTAGMLAAHLGRRVFASDAHLAMYAGVAPLEASSAGHVRHRLNRTGNRRLKAIIHRIALSQSRHSAQAQAYLAKKRNDGKTHKEAFRCLKRLLARVILTAWRQCQVPSLVPLDATPTSPLDT